MYTHTGGCNPTNLIDRDGTTNGKPDEKKTPKTRPPEEEQGQHSQIHESLFQRHATQGPAAPNHLNSVSASSSSNNQSTGVNLNSVSASSSSNEQSTVSTVATAIGSVATNLVFPVIKGLAFGGLGGAATALVGTTLPAVVNEGFQQFAGKTGDKESKENQDKLGKASSTTGALINNLIQGKGPEQIVLESVMGVVTIDGKRAVINEALRLAPNRTSTAIGMYQTAKDVASKKVKSAVATVTNKAKSALDYGLFVEKMHFKATFGKQD